MSERHRPLLPSLLDRLIDLDPGVSREPPSARHQVLREVKVSLRRDLEHLLNTRARNLVWDPARMPELNKSLADYGLPDFTSVNLFTETDRARFCGEIEEIIRRHEPRLANVRVVPVAEEEALDRSFSFRILAELDVDPAPEPVLFDSHLKQATNTFEVGGDR
jgi:type VI secretion system protein ImpF